MVETIERQKVFKQTEVGIIPSDWEVKSLGQFGVVSGRVGWKGYTKKDIRNSGPYAIGAKHINKSNRLDLSDPTYLSIEKYLESPEIMVFKEDILIVQRGSIGKVVLIDREIGEATINPSMVIFRLKKNSPVYVFYYLISSPGQNQIVLDTSSTGVPMITQKQVSNFKIPLPPTKAEQTAIATVLNDADALITQLEKLIAKKRAIKQGAMHELLTGEKKLDGYNDDWHEIELRGIVDQFIVPMRDKPKRFSGDTPWCRIEDFEGKYLYDSKAKQYVDESTILAMNLKVFPKETLIVSCSADLGRCAILKRPLVTNQTFIGLVVNKVKASNEFLYYFIGFNSERLNQLSSGTTIAYLSREQFESFKVIIPKTKDEQTHIAQILSDMDAEIEALENKLNKYKMIKQGMMQNLLTGRIRLV